MYITRFHDISSKTIACGIATLCSMAFACPAHADKKETYNLYGTEPDAYIEPLRPQPIAPTPEYTFQIKPRMHRYMIGTTKGIDVSHHQGRINWRNTAIDQHASYAYIKATESVSHVDRMYYKNISEARAANIPVGFYHFYRPNASPSTQLLNMTRTVPNLRNQDLLPMIDVEVRGRGNIEIFRRNLRQFLRSVEKHYGVRPIIYTGVNFYNKYLCGHFDEYMYMMARYGDEIPCPDGNPKLVMWQYSESGRVAGIRGDVDLSTFMDNYTLSDIMIPRRNKRK